MAERHSTPQVLVTGASGFIASHIIQQLLISGQVKVRGTVRSLKNEAKVAPLLSIVSNPTYPLELVEAELLNEESWKEAVKECTHVYHVASPLPSSTPRDEKEVVRPAVEGTLNVLKACHQAGTVKRVVLTSSLGAISAGLYGEEREYSESDWSSEQICPPYEKSKLLAEIAAWDFVEKLDKENQFELVAIHPSVVIGPPLTVANGEATALGTVKKLIANEIPVLLHLNLPLVDVRDVATAHILAMESPSAPGNRYIITAENRWLKDIAAVIAEEFRPQGYKVPKWVIPKPGVWLLRFLDTTVRLVYPIVGKEIRYNNEKMRSELGLKTRDVNSTIIECCYALIELGIVTKEKDYNGPVDSNDSSLKHLTSTIFTEDKEEEVHLTVNTTTEEKEEHPTVTTENKEEEVHLTVDMTTEDKEGHLTTQNKEEVHPTVDTTTEEKEEHLTVTTEDKEEEVHPTVDTTTKEKEEHSTVTTEDKEEAIHPKMDTKGQ